LLWLRPLLTFFAPGADNPVSASLPHNNHNLYLGKMRLSRAGFFADFYVYPAAAAAFVAVAAVTAWDRWLAWSSAVLVGVFVWTFFEYILHRYVLHHVPWIREQHDAHHNEQKALIGTPTYLTFILMLVTVALPSILLTSVAVGCGFTAGVMLGYLWYVVIHYGLHNWTIKPRSYLSRLKRRHALHHHFDDLGNFGVTSGFWDYVFGTNVSNRPTGSSPTELHG
jgi:sterol desaturase/sphingolipid hydroxylase (fatty acid hydroxylase superfamily)